MHGIFDFLSRILPLNMASRMTGRFVRIHFPRIIQIPLNKLFVWFFGIDIGEAEFPIGHYRSIQEVFTRRLKVGARKVSVPICSPADGKVTQSGQIASPERALSVKGHDYDPTELIWGMSQGSAGNELGWYHVVYLAPHNYHRVHSPLTGSIRLVRHIPGDVWSVSPRLIKYIPKLFCRNERLVFEIDDEEGQTVYVVMVAAFNVGCMSSPYLPDFLTNAGGQKAQEFRPKINKVRCGDELGIFHLGSTVVCIFPKAYSQRHSFVHCTENTPILMGQTIISK